MGVEPSGRRKEREMPEVQEVFRMSTQKVKPDPGALQRQHTRQRRRSVGKKMGAFAVAAAFGVTALVVALAIKTGDRGEPADTITPGPFPTDPYFLDLGSSTVTPLPEQIVLTDGYYN